MELLETIPSILPVKTAHLKMVDKTGLAGDYLCADRNGLYYTPLQQWGLL